MASNFKSLLRSGIGTASTVVYSPTTSGIQSTIIGMSVCNTTNTAIEVSVRLVQSGTANTCFLVRNAVVSTGSTIVPVGGEQKLVIQQNDSLEVSSNTASSADVIVSVLEIT